MACSFPSSAETVDGWLDALNLARYKPTFAAAGVQVSQLPALTDDSLQAAGVAMIGHRKRMLQASKELVGHAMMPEPAPPAPFLPAAAGPSNDTQMMDVESPAWPPPPRRGTEGSFGGTAGTTTVPIIPPFPGGKNSSASSVGPVGGMLGSPATTAMPGGPAGMDTTSSGPPKSTPQQKANSTSSIYITSTLVKPDTDEVVFCIAAVIHDRIQQGEAQSSQDRHLFPFFSEDNNPLYAPPPDRDPRDGPASDSGSDSSMKRTRREIPTEDMIFHTIRSVYECARIPAECLIVSLVYIERLITVSGCPMLVTSWRPILLSSLILAQKVWDDRSLHNIDFSVFCPMFTLKEINFLEKKFLELIDYDVSISASLYASYYFQLRTLCQRVDRDFSLKPMDVDVAAKLEARGVAYKDKFKQNHGVARKHQSDNNIHLGAPGQQSNFISKLFG